MRFLSKSLEGALSQTYPRYEIVIADNWSSDGTREMCLALTERDPRVRYVRPPILLGQFGNHNFAFGEARGDYVSYFHDDDLHRSDLLSRFVDFLGSHPTVGAVSSDWDRMDQDDRPLSPRVNEVPDVTPGIEYIERTIRSGRSSVALPGSLVRRDALPESPFDEAAPAGFNDLVTWFRLAEQWDVGHVPQRLWSYRQHSGAGSSRRIGEAASDLAANFTRYADEYLARHPADIDRVARWRQAIRRHRFWSLAYELALHARGDEVNDTASVRYALSSAEIKATIQELHMLAESPIERFAAAITPLVLSAGASSVLARNVDLARRILRMR